MSEKKKTGYGCPPSEHQFKPGTSGNPRGRPSGPLLPTLERSWGYGMLDGTDRAVLEELYRLVPIQEGGKLRKVPLITVVIRKQLQKALSGDRLAMRDLLKAAGAAERAKTIREEKEMAAFVDYKQWAEKQIRLREAAGQSIEDILPHPADIEIYAQEGRLVIAGPMNTTERAALDDTVAFRRMCQDQVNEAAASYAAAVNPAQKRAALKSWHAKQLVFDLANDRLPKSLWVNLLNRSTAPGATKSGDKAFED